MIVAEVRPDCADIVIVEELGIPGIAVQDETVPLDAQSVTGRDMSGQVAEHEPRIVATRCQPPDRTPLNGWVRPIRWFLVAKQKHFAELSLAH